MVLKAVFGARPAKMKGRLDGILYRRVWLLATRQAEGEIMPTEGHSIEHLGFSFPDLEATALEITARR